MVESISIVNIQNKNELIMDKLNTEDFVLGYVNWNSAESEKFTTKYLEQIGSTIVRSVLQMRPIEIVGYAIAETEEQMSQRKKFLNAFVSPLEFYIAKYNGYAIQFQPTMSIQYANEEETNNNEYICKFKISGICPDPLFSLEEDMEVKLALYSGKFHFPLQMTQEEPVVFGTKVESRTIIINNFGDVSTGMVFTITAKGTVVNPTVTNMTTGDFFTINKTLAEGDVVVVNTRIGSKSVQGGTPGSMSNYFRYKTLQSKWIQLQKGLNNIRYSATSGADNMAVDISYSPRFMEVQECY